MTTSEHTRPSTFRAVVFDLFGTLVDAPSQQDRHDAAHELADALGVPTTAVRDALARSWRDRHLGQWDTVDHIAAGLARLCRATRPDLPRAGRLIENRARQRLRWDASVLTMLTQLADKGLAVMVLSDAAADTAHAWPNGAPTWLPVLFSCQAQAVKPDPALYQRVLHQLAVPAQAVLYCGDGGGDELAGARRAGMTAVHVPVRGGPNAVTHHRVDWNGPHLQCAEHAPRLVTGSDLVAAASRS